MTSWRDGMGRVTVKCDTGAAKRYEMVMGGDGLPRGICRAPGWMVIQGPFIVKIIGVDLTEVRANQMQHARRKRRPGHQRNLRSHASGVRETVGETA